MISVGSGPAFAPHHFGCASLLAHRQCNGEHVELDPYASPDTSYRPTRNSTIDHPNEEALVDGGGSVIEVVLIEVGDCPVRPCW